MKISESSWHFRYMRWVWRETGNGFQEPRTLCSYFWLLVFTLLALTPFISSMIAVAIVAFVLTAPIWLPIWGLHRLWKRYRMAVPEISALGIAIEYAKTAKRGVCPFIEYVE